MLQQTFDYNRLFSSNFREKNILLFSKKGKSQMQNICEKNIKAFYVEHNNNNNNNNNNNKNNLFMRMKARAAINSFIFSFQSCETFLWGTISFLLLQLVALRPCCSFSCCSSSTEPTNHQVVQCVLPSFYGA